MKKKKEQIELETKEEEDTEGKTAKSRKLYDDYKVVYVKGKGTQPMLGGISANEDTCLKYNVSSLNMVKRDEEGDMVIGADSFKASLRDSATFVGLTEGVVKWLGGWTSAKLKLNGTKPFITTKHIQPRVRGIPQGRVVNYETIKDYEFETKFYVPNKGIGMDKFKKWVNLAFESGYGAYRKGCYGSCQITDFKVKDL